MYWSTGFVKISHSRQSCK